MVVVILIGILTMMAIPAMSDAHYNARTLDDATKIAEIYREGRTRAMARGAAMLVQLSTANLVNSFVAAPAPGNGGLGVVFLSEARAVAGGLLPLPVGSPLSSCGSPATSWFGAAPTSVLIDEVNLNQTSEVQAQIWSTVNDGSGAAPAVASLCFTPLGRVYYLPTATPTFTPGVNVLNGELQIAVQRSGIAGNGVTGLTRTVIVPASGSTRIVSR